MVDTITPLRDPEKPSYRLIERWLKAKAAHAAA
jgi:hypothetical protein